ncbi:MAG: hypothetical protein FWF63_00370 [Fibromonadales bacterium]|nr:hypothetical protein [Fibromonadales bacterium]
MNTTRDMAKQYEELKALCKPLNQWLQLYYPPNTRVLVEQGYATLFGDDVSVNYEFFDDEIPLKRDPSLEGFTGGLRDE